jgi:DNA ligase D-like protein (predicted 3'-phosphoesterase)
MAKEKARRAAKGAAGEDEGGTGKGTPKEGPKGASQVVRCEPAKPWAVVPPELQDIFVVQRHEASRLHWDLRLSMDGVLKSWAVPKEPPAERGTKRLAVAVDDHDLSYHDFEGVIDEGKYGAGRVEIWDRGRYRLVSRSADKVEFELEGTRLKGRYVLLRFPKGGEKAWLFFKAA